MDDICLPVRFEGLTEDDVKAHLRYCAANSKLEYGVEFLLCDVGVVIPVVRRIYKKKSATLEVLIRSGSVGRDKLGELKTTLAADGFELKLSLTSKRKLLQRIVVPLKIDDGFMPVIGLNVLRSVASALNLSWPCRLAIGYALGSEDAHLPGQIVFRDPYRNAGYHFGFAVGKLLRKINS